MDKSKPWTIKLSSAGLVYVHFGREILAEIVKKHSINDDKLVDVLFDKMYEQFVREIDAIDNGVEIAETKKYDITTNLSARVSYFNPAWNQPDLDENASLKKSFIFSIFKYYSNRLSFIWLLSMSAKSLRTE